jgi:hypothetical protein
LAAALALSLGGLPAAYGAEAGDGSGVGAPSDVGADAASVGGPDATYGVAQGIGSATDPETPVLVDIAAPPAPASAAGVMPLGAVVAAQVTDSASGLVFDVRDSSAWCGAGAYVTGYEGSSASVSVPATLGGQPVVYVSLASLPREGLTSLNVSACSGSLKYLYCGSDSLGNSLVSLNVSGCAALVELDCRFSRSLASLDVSDCASLERLTCHEVGLASLDVGGLTALESLFCYKVGLSSLNVSGCA